MFFLQEKLLDFHGYIKYEVLGHKFDMSVLPRTIQMSIDRDVKNKTIMASSETYPGLMTIASSDDELTNQINDAIFTYFGVPRYIAQKTPNMFLPRDKEKKIEFVMNKELAYV